MAVFGSPFASGFGKPDLHLAYLSASQDGASIDITLQPAADVGDAYFGIYLNSVKVRSVLIAEGASTTVSIPASSATRQNLTILREGHTAILDMQDVARIFDAETANAITATWTWPLEFIGLIVDDDEDETLANASLTGIRHYMLGSVEGKATRGDIAVSLSVDAGTASIVLSDVSGNTIGSGSGAVGGSVTITGTVSGTIDVDAGASTLTGDLRYRYPAQMAVYVDTDNPPTDQDGVVAFDQSDSSTYTATGLAAGTYYVALRPTSDTGDVAAKGTADSATVAGAPVAPTDLAYDSGNAAATVITWTESTTVGATYNIYVKNVDDDVLDTSTAATTSATGTDSKTLPAITGYPGVAQVLIRAEFGGAEEKNGELLLIEYDAAGDYVAPRPNGISMQKVSVSSGTSLSVQCSYDTTGEAGTATTAQIFARDPDGSYDFGTPDGTAALSANYSGLKYATVTASLANGWHWITAKAATVAGVQSLNQAQEVLVYVSDVDATAPTPTLTTTGG